jgi:hypothetical protein
MVIRSLIIRITALTATQFQRFDDILQAGSGAHILARNHAAQEWPACMALIMGRCGQGKPKIVCLGRLDQAKS